jgi:type II secretory pathway pseudopilin PulG
MAASLTIKEMNTFLKTSKAIKNKSGFTLIELIIVTSIMIIMILVVAQVYVMGMVQSKSDLAKAQLQTEGKSTMDGIIKNTKLASSVEASYGGYTTGSTNLVLKVPAIDTGENFLYNPPDSSIRDYDYIIYHFENKNLHKVIYSINPNSRLYAQNNTDNIILSNVKSLSFTYPGVSMVTVNVTIENTTQKKPIEVNLTANGRLRNVQ